MGAKCSVRWVLLDGCGKGKYSTRIVVVSEGVLVGLRQEKKDSISEFRHEHPFSAP